ncbi:MAG: SulP family inorganic anion transporter [Opitutales bacterium]|nr:SulP family inorganic anion transporter [Opitutales bacterium]
MFSNYSREWFSNVPRDLVAGLVVALALIPEAIAFSIIAGVDPQVGLYASFCIAVVIAFTGGRPGMISAATGAMALLMVLLVREHGLEYLLVATILTGVIQILAGLLKLGNLLKFVSRSVLTGFINALAILIFMAQLPEFKGQGWEMYAMVAGGLVIIYLFPKITKSIPSPLVCIIALTLFAVFTGMGLPTIGDKGELPSTLPVFLFPDVPLNLETLLIVMPYVIPLVIVGLLESAMTASIVDELTDTDSNKNQECVGQGIANTVSGFFGGMAGCAMVGQTVINVKSGGRGRLSSFAAGIFLIIMVVVLGKYLALIPMAALVAVMIMVAIGTFHWGSLKDLRNHPKTSSLIMITTVVVVVYTHNLAIGVGVGILMSVFSFARKAALLVRVGSELKEDGEERTYFVDGNLFFVSAERFTKAFDHREVLSKVTIDLNRAHFWDITSVAALDKVVLKFRRSGAEVEVLGLNEASATLVSRVAVHDKDDADQNLSPH